MTDPFQPVDPQTQTPAASQPKTDDILGGEDIFATIPEVEEDDLPYGDVLQKKYENNQQTEPAQVVPQIQTQVSSQPENIATPQVAPQATSTEVPEETILEPIAQQTKQNIIQQAGVEQAKVETLWDTQLQTDVQKKFGELFFTTKRIYDIKTKLGISSDYFDVLGADNDKVFISYRFILEEIDNPVVRIAKIEQNKVTQEETSNELRFMFNSAASSLEVMVNDTMLFDEIQDFTEDQKKKMQVSEKLNKFIFLASEEQRKGEKELQAKAEAEAEKRKLQDIFRNF